MAIKYSDQVDDLARRSFSTGEQRSYRCDNLAPSEGYDLRVLQGAQRMLSDARMR